MLPFFPKTTSHGFRHSKPHLSYPRFTHSSSPSPQPPDAAIANAVLAATDAKTLAKSLLTETPNPNWSSELVDRTLKRLWNHGPKALQFFKILDRHPSYAHAASSFDLAIDVAARLHDFRTLWTLVQRMHSLRLGPNPKTFAIVIERYVSFGKPDKGIKIFLSMHKFGVKQDLNCFNTLLDVLCKSNRAEKAEELFRMFRGRFGADVVTYNVMANGWCLIKRTPKALAVLKEMVERGVDPNMTTYNIMLKGYFRAGQIEEAWRFFLEMKKRRCEIDVVSYTTLVHGFGVGGEVRRARRVFDEMVKEGVLPSIVTYNALIQVLCKKDSVMNAVVVFEEMLRKGYVPNSTTYNVLIRGLCHADEMERAVELMGRMKEDECEPNVQTFNLMTRYYCEAGEIEKGLEIFERMCGGECLPNLDTYNVLIRSMFVRKKPEDLVVAGRLLIDMIERGFLPRKFTFNRVLNGLLVTGNQAFAKEIIRLQNKHRRLSREFRL